MLMKKRVVLLGLVALGVEDVQGVALAAASLCERVMSVVPLHFCHCSYLLSYSYVHHIDYIQAFLGILASEGGHCRRAYSIATHKRCSHASQLVRELNTLRLSPFAPAQSLCLSVFMSLTAIQS